MTAAAFPWDTDVANDAANSPAAHKHAAAFPPDPVQFRKEAIVVFEMSHLAVVARGVLLQGPVGR